MIKWSLTTILVLFWLSMNGCAGFGPQAMGEAGEEFIIMVPGDTIQTDKGMVLYVDGDGMLRGFEDYEIQAAGRKMRDVMNIVDTYQPLVNYTLIKRGKRYVDLQGDVRRPGRYEYPANEYWNVTNLFVRGTGFLQNHERKEFLLVRKSWDFKNSFLFLRGEIISGLEGIGGGELDVIPGDLVIFTGAKDLVYVFGSVNKSACFSIAPQENKEVFFVHPPGEKQKKAPKKFGDLKVAIEKAGGFLDNANKENIQIYRVLRSEKQTIINVNWEREPNFALLPWDIIHVPSSIPKEFISNSSE